MIRLDVACALLVSAVGLLIFELAVMLHNGYLQSSRRRHQKLGDFEKPVLLARALVPTLERRRLWGAGKHLAQTRC